MLPGKHFRPALVQAALYELRSRLIMALTFLQLLFLPLYQPSRRLELETAFRACSGHLLTSRVSLWIARATLKRPATCTSPGMMAVTRARAIPLLRLAAEA